MILSIKVAEGFAESDDEVARACEINYGKCDRDHHEPIVGHLTRLGSNPSGSQSEPGRRRHEYRAVQLIARDATRLS